MHDKPYIYCKTFLNSYQSGENSPNLVALVFLLKLNYHQAIGT